MFAASHDISSVQLAFNQSLLPEYIMISEHVGMNWLV